MACSSREDIWAQGACGQEGRGPLAAAVLSHNPESRWVKLVLTSGRPGSKHRGVSMETQQHRTKWGLEMGGWPVPCVDRGNRR